MKSKTLILDYKKWRCGADGKNKLGEGDTLLHNDEGFECCLGQFSYQLRKTLRKKDICGKGTPNEIRLNIPLLVEKLGDFRDSDLSVEAMDINDDVVSKPVTKIKRLKRLFKKYDYEIEVINAPSDLVI